VCSFAVEDVYLSRYYNILGKATDRVLKKSMIQGASDSLTWGISPISGGIIQLSVKKDRIYCLKPLAE
jgi:hypothetical protein